MGFHKLYFTCRGKYFYQHYWAIYLDRISRYSILRNSRNVYKILTIGPKHLCVVICRFTETNSRRFNETFPAGIRRCWDDVIWCPTTSCVTAELQATSLVFLESLYSGNSFPQFNTCRGCSTRYSCSSFCQYFWGMTFSLCPQDWSDELLCVYRHKLYRISLHNNRTFRFPCYIATTTMQRKSS